MHTHSLLANAQEGDPLDQLLNALVADQVWRTEDKARSEGLSESEIRLTLLQESWRLVVLMLRDRYDSLWPDPDMFETVLQVLLQCEAQDSQLLCREFIGAGWLNAEYQITGAGLWIAGLAREG